MTAHAWLRGPVTGDKAVRLLCIPHAGGGASFFNSWTLRLEHELDVVRLQLPGREDRAGEAPLRDIASVLAEACPAVHAHLSDRPLIVYGHSLGALIAFEIARRSAARGRPPVALMVSSRRAPQCPLRRPPTCELPEPELIEHIVGLGTTSARMMRAAHFRDHFVPTLRADLAMTDRYRLAPARCLTSPLFAYRGENDPIVDADEMHAWSLQARSSFRLRTVQGGHFLAASGVAIITADILELARSCGRKETR